MRVLLIGQAIFSLLTLASGLKTLSKEISANGFNTAFRGWSSFALQSYNLPVPGGQFGNRWLKEANLRTQAQSLSALGNGYNTFMIDSGWSQDGGDEFGRITWNRDVFNDFPAFVNELHGMGLKVGVYIIPGVFNSDIIANKPIVGGQYTMNQINTPCDPNDKTFPCAFLRRDLDFTHHSAASNAWVQSVVNQFSSWGIDLIKFDYLNPTAYGKITGSYYSNEADVKSFHNAIQSSSPRRQMWLLESFDLSIDDKIINSWRQTGDSYRIATDINNTPGSGGDTHTTLVSWFAIQRTVEAQRYYMTNALSKDRSLKGYPDLDAMFIGNNAPLNQLNADQRKTYFSLWIVFGVPIYLGDDLTTLDPGYKNLLTHTEVLNMHSQWTSTISPGFYLNQQGTRDTSQLQIWEAGPFGDRNEVVVLLVNMGCTEDASKFPVPWQCVRGPQNVVATFKNLQLSESYCNRDVWGGRDTGRADTQISAVLNEGQSMLYRLTPRSKAPGLC